ncbi:Crp/Fnr family transcriptional regulator [Terasakiella sp. A23]|uniref:Crp/Fnr family transcriptional regulator n=1 Tax=Terasakiella sp. FCG-A23 TaxID=3080561 RepID=UPI00295448CF|nr:Crp/Fnr family transcriptional regulator [Terasakiella sp. A23]MDV7340524.1 Crp/Fnr family transcriptional regulator [Terasakiella sp. A23]
MNQITNIPGFEKLSADDAAFIQPHLQQITVPVGAKVFETGSTCGAFLMVLDGCVRVQMIGETGREIVLYRVEDGQTCILTTACLLSGDLYSAEAITESETTAIALPVAQFNELLNRSQVFRELVFASYGTRISNLVSLVEEVAFGRVDLRLAQFLLDRSDSQSILKKTHYELAVELGTAREVISRQLKEFERKGWITLSRGQVKITDKSGLQSFISAECD